MFLMISLLEEKLNDSCDSFLFPYLFSVETCTHPSITNLSRPSHMGAWMCLARALGAFQYESASLAAEAATHFRLIVSNSFQSLKKLDPTSTSSATNLDPQKPTNPWLRNAPQIAKPCETIGLQGNPWCLITMRRQVQDQSMSVSAPGVRQGEELRERCRGGGTHLQTHLALEDEGLGGARKAWKEHPHPHWIHIHSFNDMEFIIIYQHPHQRPSSINMHQHASTYINHLMGDTMWYYWWFMVVINHQLSTVGRYTKNNQSTSK